MTKLHNSPAENLHAYIDGELSVEEREAFEEAMQLDESLKEEVCELRKIKQQMLEHYQKIEVPPMPKLEQKPSDRMQRYWPIAASLFLAFGVGFLAAKDMPLNSVSPGSGVVLKVAENQQNDKVILHIDSDQPNRVNALLQKASTMLQNQPPGAHPVQVEIVANDHGIDLFEKGNHNRAAIIALLAKYDNLKLVACERALERRAQSGHPVQLIDHVESDRPALDEIVDKMRKGWTYYRF